jgi:hypothetical protein
MANSTDRIHRPGDGSTGPKTPAGLEASSRNAFRHGGCSDKHLILPTEKQEDFDNLLQYWLDHYECTSEDKEDRRFIQHLAEREWQFRRCEKLLDQAWFKYLSQNPDPEDWTPAQHSHLALLRRYRNAAERDYQTAWKNVEALRKNRINETLLGEKTKDLYFLNRKRGFYDNARPLFEEEPEPTSTKKEPKPWPNPGTQSNEPPRRR